VFETCEPTSAASTSWWHEGELVICRHGRPIARVLPMAQHRQAPDHADLRSRMAPLQTSSAELIRAERDER